MKTFIVYATGEHGRPLDPENPNPPCFEVKVNAETRKDAINKVAADRKDYAVAHQFCNWDAYVEDAA